LQPVQAKRGQDRCILAAEHAEDAAFLVRLVVIGPFVCQLRRRLIETKDALGGHSAPQGVPWLGAGWGGGIGADSPLCLSIISRARSRAWGNTASRTLATPS